MEELFILIFWIIISVFSTLRVTQLLHEEDGPFNFLQHIRDVLGASEFVKLSEEEQNEILAELNLEEDDELPLYNLNTVAGNLFECIRCLSFWIAIPHVLILFLSIGFNIVFIPILTLAISAMVVKIYEAT